MRNIHFKFLNISGDQTKPLTRKYIPWFGLENKVVKPSLPTNGNDATPKNIIVAKAAA